MNATVRLSRSFSRFFFALFVLLGLNSTARAESEGPYRMEVLVNGYSAREYRHQGTTYIEARRGEEYAVRLSNMTGERVAVALSVDGLNSINARHTSARDARKWILGPYETIVVEGWQTSSNTARSFYFTSEAASYGAWVGDTRNLGNISAAFFRELRPVPRPQYYEQAPESRKPSAEADEAYPMKEAARGKAGASAAAPSAEKSMEAGGSADKSYRSAAPEQKSNSLAATGIGREQRNDVYTVAFRQESSPAAVMTIRYEYRPQLIKLGVVPPPPHRPDPMVRRENSSGFTDYGYAPDPYAR
jgi:hypothetical protein